MTANTVKIPQADVLWDVARVAEAVARGVDTPDAIASYIGAKGPRQGHYYAQAARILGLLDGEAAPHQLRLTPYGRAFASYSRDSQRQALRRLLRDREPTRSVLAALAQGRALDLPGIIAVLRQIAPLAESTARRRAQTIAAWLVSADLARWADGRLAYQPTPPKHAGFFRTV